MDALHDNSRRVLYSIASAYENLFPAYVLDTELSKEAADGLPDRQFADADNRLFPLDSAAATWLSAAYFTKNAEKLVYAPALRDYVESRILKAANVYGIQNDVAAIMKAIRSDMQEKTAADTDDCYGWVEKQANVRLYPMFDEHGVKLACDHFEENRYKYPVAMRRTIAQNIVKRANALKYANTLPECVRIESGDGVPRRDTLMAELFERARRCKDASVAMLLGSLSEVVAVTPMDELRPELEKLAEVIEEADRISGLHTQYGKTVLSPSDIIYMISHKEAEELSADSVELNKHVFSLTKLSELDPSVFGEALGLDFVERITVDGKMNMQKLADELYSLPMPDKNALEEHLERAFA